MLRTVLKQLSHEESLETVDPQVVFDWNIV